MAGSYLAFELDELQQKYAAAESPLQRIPAPARHVGRAVRPAGRCRGQADTRTWPTRCTSSCRAAARLRVVDEEIEVKPGSIISVDHGEEHQFINVTEDLQMLVVFAPPDLPDEE